MSDSGSGAGDGGKIWSGIYPVHSYEMDARQRVSIQGICNFLIDAAGHNAHALGFNIPQLQEQGRTWFFTRFLLRMRHYPAWQEQITVQTWPSGTQKLFALRDWRLFRGRQPIGEATSGWLMIDNSSRRPLRPEKHGHWPHLIHRERAVPHTFGSLPALQEGLELAGEREFSVGYSDVDINRHANYLSYINWLLESLPPELRSAGSIAEMEIHYLYEASYGEALISRSQPEAAPAPGEEATPPAGQPGWLGFRHSLLRRQDSLELARARTLWREDP